MVMSGDSPLAWKAIFWIFIVIVWFLSQNKRDGGDKIEKKMNRIIFNNDVKIKVIICISCLFKVDET